MITSFQDILRAVARLLDLLLPLVMGAAFLFFLWGLATFVLAAGDEKKHDEGRSKMIWGVVTLFVMVSLWGIVALMQSEVLGDGGSSRIPVIRND